MPLDAQAKASFSPRQRWRIMLNISLTTLVVLAVVVMANYLSHDLFVRLCWSGQARAELSPLTRNFLRSLTNQVKVTLFFDKQDWLYGTASDLLELYHAANPRIGVRAVDVVLDPAGAQQVREQGPVEFHGLPW